MGFHETDSFYTLQQVLDALAQAVDTALPRKLWIVAEIAQMSTTKGHVYLDLVQKERGTILAKTKAMIWQSQARVIFKGFQETTGQALGAGISVLMSVTASLHPVYGLGLTVHAIDSDYTLGELSRQKREIINRLDLEGYTNLNKSLPDLVVPLRVGVISSRTAAGYGDFVHQLRHNLHGYRFSHKLFEAAMQGDGADRSICDAIGQAERMAHKFDVLVVIRGGGSKIDMHCFDSYSVAKQLACFPIPVLTGIGHERDESVADLVAFQSCKTPTAVAEYLICRVVDFEQRLLDCQAAVVKSSTIQLNICREQIENLAHRLQAGVFQYTSSKAYELRALTEQICIASLLRMERERATVERLADKIKLLDPVNVLRRGYSLVYVDGTLVRGTGGVAIGDSLVVSLIDGRLEAIVANIADEGTTSDAV